ncbi:hypothetical protein FW755_01650 [Lonepinella koalarum]|uniref:AsmA-like protein n=1 Tax=Lonepinella koalarum TaxID=53417 RepID=A0A4R1KYL3_9PAST|nr:hypothetical protein [Lonepinella koalarum]MDH2926744.1 hypothetical protein [Lonepinella koalarum]TCK70596.1 AsmA-like protein [Lonepinella koalarum]TFJ90023.1 hypothetical protein E0709_05085 [Lonepinella koalarum]TYG33884.1 hypothetical protein FW755_01650 [Lonepinella koalarum]
MLKKISAVLLLLILVFSVFVYIQKGKMEQKLTALLSENAVQVDKIDIDFLPRISVKFINVDYVSDENQQLQAQSLQAELSFWGLLTGDIGLQSFVMQQGKIFYSNSLSPDMKDIHFLLTPKSTLSVQDLLDWLKSFNAGNMRLPTSELTFSAKTAQNDQIELKTILAINFNGVQFSHLDGEVLLQNKRLFNQNKFILHAEQGFVTFMPNNYAITLIHPLFNQVKLNSIEITLETKNALSISIQLSHVANNGSLSVKLNEQQNQYIWQLNGKQLPLEDWLKAFNIAALVTGRADAQIRLLSKEIMPTSGEFYFDVMNGKIKGLNVLALISRYAPINFDESTKNIDTSFDFAQTKFQWQPDVIQVDQAKVQHKYFILQSQGVVDLLQGRCDFQANIALNEQRYQSLALPVRFFGSCQSPEYKVEINRSFRDQLKNFIKEKLK